MKINGREVEIVVCGMDVAATTGLPQSVNLQPDPGAAGVVLRFVVQVDIAVPSDARQPAFVAGCQISTTDAPN